MDAIQLSKALLSYMPMDHKKLQKIAYYSQAWYLTLFNDVLIDDVFQAWVHGPVCPTIYHEYKHHGWNEIPQSPHAIEISPEIRNFLESIIETFGKYSGDELEYMTHLETPWKSARENINPWEPSTNTISTESMKEFYTKLKEASQTE